MESATAAIPWKTEATRADTLKMVTVALGPARSITHPAKNAPVPSVSTPTSEEEYGNRTSDKIASPNNVANDTGHEKEENRIQEGEKQRRFIDMLAYGKIMKEQVHGTDEEG